jgi:homoserine O-acetyltransferase
VPLLAVNSADDQVNPPVRFDGKNIQLVKKENISYCLTDLTSGHGTHSNPTIWGNT